MNRLLKERLLTFGQAVKDPRLKRNGRSPHIASMHRWADAKDDPLEYVVVGGVKMTSEEAVERFIERRTLARNPRAVRDEFGADGTLTQRRETRQ